MRPRETVTNSRFRGPRVRINDAIRGETGSIGGHSERNPALVLGDPGPL